jgi:hypothetical protein
MKTIKITWQMYDQTREYITRAETLADAVKRYQDDIESQHPEAELISAEEEQ